jgi:hypothetical protein
MREPDPSRRRIEAPEEGRRQRQRMGGRAHVMPEAGQRELLGAAAAAGAGRALDHVHAQPRGGERHGGGQAVGPASHHDRVGVT